MKTWADGKSGEERAAAVAEALRVAGSVTKAAPLLGISRRYLTKILSEIKARGENKENSGNGENHATEGHGAMHEGENSTLSNSLTYRHREPTLSRMGTAVAVAPEAHETSKLTMEFPKRVKDWAEQKALARKQREGGRFAIAPIFVELAEREMAREEEERAAAEPAAEKPAKKKAEKA